MTDQKGNMGIRKVLSFIFLGVFLLLCICLWLLSIFSLFDNTYDDGHSYLSSRSYEINKQISEDGIRYIFTEVPITSTVENSELGILSSQDFLEIFIEFLSQVESEIASDWKVHELFFRSDCSLKDEGFKVAGFVFFKEDVKNSRIGYRSVKKISMNVNDKISIDESEYVAHKWDQLNEWSSINYFEILPPETILDIAYSYAGNEFARSHPECSIKLSLGVYKDYFWVVNFTTPPDYQERIEIIINPLTGEIVTGEE